MQRGLRLVAYTLDFVLALLTVLAFRLLLHFDDLQGRPPVVDAQILWLVLLMLASRDVLLPVSPAKWLLCLQLRRTDGRPLSFAQRLLRAPLSVFPLALLPRRIQEALWWRAEPHSPDSAGLVARLVTTATAAAVSLIWAIHTFQPSISDADADRVAHALVEGDARLRDHLGEPIHFDIGPVARRAERLQGGTAQFRLRLRGTQGLQDMVVVARKVDGRWAIEELTDIQIVSFQRGDADLAERR